MWRNIQHITTIKTQNIRTAPALLERCQDWFPGFALGLPRSPVLARLANCIYHIELCIAGNCDVSCFAMRELDQQILSSKSKVWYFV